MKSITYSKCSLVLTSCNNHDALIDVNDDISSCGLICTSCVELESEVLALKQMHDDMSAKLVEHNEMSANLEKEIELLRTTYAKCIEKEMDNLRMRFWSHDARVFILSLWILAILVTPILVLLKLLLLNWSWLLVLSVSLWTIVLVLVLWIALL